VDLSDEFDHGPHTDTVMAVIATPQEAAATSSDPLAEPQPEPLAGDEEIAALASSADPAELAAAQREADAATNRAARWRTMAFLAAIVGVVALAFGAIFYTASRGWYVSSDDDGFVALYRGTPVLWLQPELVETSQTAVDDLAENQQKQVSEGITFTQEEAARERIESLRVTTTTTSTTTTTTTTTVVAPVPQPPTPSAPAGAGP
jgi:hypothetical protein